MKTRFLIPVLVLLVALCGIAFWLFQKPAGTEELVQDTKESERLDPEEFLRYDPPDSRVNKPETAGELELPADSQHAIPGEYTLFFEDQDAYEAFLNRARSHGVDIRGAIPQLMAIRVGASGGRLAGLLDDSMVIDNNYRVSAPVMPDFYSDPNLSAFGADLLKFLGIPEDASRFSWGEGVKIAVLDTGWIGHTSAGGLKVSQIDLVTGAVTGDYAGHGTAVAGLIGSTNPFAPGVAPGSEILSVRVLDAAGEGDSFTLANGIISAVDNGANVINMSLGGYQDSEALRRAVAYAIDEGVVLVAASGNDGLGTVTYPAAYDTVIGTTAIDENSNRTNFSNFGEGVDVAAPGYQIHSLWENDDFIYFNGTSASSPIVSGLVARLLQTGKATTPAEVQELLRTYANDTGPPDYDIQYGAGVVNADRLENIGKSGVYDLALADLYPATEESDGSNFPLYVTVQNRGTEYIPSATVELSVNGRPYYYRFSGFDQGTVESIQVPVPEAALEGTEPFSVSAKVIMPSRYTDQQTGNDEGNITLTKVPDDG